MGGVAGLIEGYKLTAEFLRPHAESPAPPSAFASALNDLKAQYLAVKLAFQGSEHPQLVALDSAFEYFKRHYNQNANTYYYEAEISRIKDTAHFNSDGCLQIHAGQAAESAAALEGVLKLSHTLFYRYLEAAGPIIDHSHSNDMSADACYANETGACIQRRAWVNHLLANDFYELGLLQGPEAPASRALFKRALGHAELATAYKPPNGPEGFAQCVDTDTLKNILQKKLVNDFHVAH